MSYLMFYPARARTRGDPIFTDVTVFECLLRGAVAQEAAIFPSMFIYYSISGSFPVFLANADCVAVTAGRAE